MLDLDSIGQRYIKQLLFFTGRGKIHWRRTTSKYLMLTVWFYVLEFRQFIFLYCAYSIKICQWDLYLVLELCSKFSATSDDSVPVVVCIDDIDMFASIFGFIQYGFILICQIVRDFQHRFMLTIKLKYTFWQLHPFNISP